jgi:hypothetical protein
LCLVFLSDLLFNGSVELVPSEGAAGQSAAASGPMRGGRCRWMDGQMRAVQTNEQQMEQMEPPVDAEHPPKKPPGRAI